jgi:hypothetical protein
MPTRLVAKLWIRAREKEETQEKEQSKEKATVEEAQEEAKVNEQAEKSGRVTGRLLPIMFSRLATQKVQFTRHFRTRHDRDTALG